MIVVADWCTAVNIASDMRFLLLEPRVTESLPDLIITCSACHFFSQIEIFFISKLSSYTLGQFD